SWNALIWPLIVINSTDRTTLSAGLATLNGQYSTNYPVLMAGSTLAVIPMILLFVILQRQFVQGIALTGTKG
ncbi:MAG: carbohydrate ABC transporter permease, partial [Acidimicrobiaceae bacterium]|nr:carbohydrate ABC transporter permease [Acidimicrobiaceae bacterium]